MSGSRRSIDQVVQLVQGRRESALKIALTRGKVREFEDLIHRDLLRDSLGLTDVADHLTRQGRFNPAVRRLSLPVVVINFRDQVFIW